jgi:flagellar L-ring protein precursor FlgH
MSHPTLTRIAAAAALVLLAAGCQQMPQKVTVDFVEPRIPAAPIASVVSKPANGSIYQTSRPPGG